MGMRRLLVLTAFTLLASATSSAADCVPTGFYRDSINLTAALVNPATASGEIDAEGCHIGVYFGPGARGAVDNAEIHGATYFGVVADAGFGSVRVDVLNSWIHHIGESPFNRAQHGIGVYYAAYEPGSAATGIVTGNTVERYQKSGIVANGSGVKVNIDGNTVFGLGPVGFIAQNGIQIGYGANASVMRNRVWGNSFTGTAGLSTGILVVGGPGSGGDYTRGTLIVGNIVLDNDVGVYVSNEEVDFSPPLIATNVKVMNNAVANRQLRNNYGGIGYQAGIVNVGNNDKLIDNTISGPGYDTDVYPSAYVVAVDADPSFTTRPKGQANRN